MTRRTESTRRGVTVVAEWNTGVDLRQELQRALGTLYVLERELSGGAMSRVFVARDPALGRRIVVKVLPREMAEAVHVERFHREIQLAASLLHPHIIPLLSAGEAGGTPYYTMPFVDGESLRVRLEREGPLPVKEAVRLASDAARALDYAHRQGIVHRDIKPGNILTHDGRALVTDFGIARAISAAARDTGLTSAGLLVGTPSYMSPEQIIGDGELDGRSDIYALGCVLFEMLAGNPPFGGGTAHAVLLGHREAPVPGVRATRADVPVHIERAIVTALAKDPASRFPSAGDLADALERADGSSGALTIPIPQPVSAEAAREHRFVAVLPFRNISADPENEYFSDGITEDIITQLGRIRDLRVISRTSSMRFKHRQRSAREVGRELGVSHVLDGSVRRAGTALRIVAQLVDTATEEQVWAETYDRQLTDVFAIQSEVAERIAEKLHTRLTPTERSRLLQKPTNDLEAYNLYLLGRHHYNKITPADFSKAVEYYRRAIGRDPGFARAYASLAEARFYLGLGYWGVRPHEALPEAFALATKSLALDPQSAEAHASVGIYHGWYEYDWQRMGAALERAIDLNPSAALIRVYYAIQLCAHGRFDEAIAQRDLACQLDPSSMAVRGNATWILYLARRMDDAVAEGRGLRDIDPASPYGAFSHGLVCAQGGEIDEAIAAFRDAVRLSDGMSLYVVMLAYGLAAGGHHAEARALVADLRMRSASEFIWPMGLAMVHTHLGEEALALDYLERSYDERVGWMPLLGREPALDRLRQSSRFQRLLERIGPPEVLLRTTSPV
jgi:eukaryotic-like serine/threonine-protein kinase